MTVPVRMAQERGIKTIAYLDDFILWANSREECAQQTIILVGILEGLGFILNRDKSVLEPSQLITWLGIEWNTR